jgi:hypothetical protein
MRLLTIASLALACAAPAAIAQPVPYSSSQDGYQAPSPDTTYNPNVQSYQNYQNAMSAYDSARDASARENDDFQARNLQYQADQRAYHHQLRAYERARDDYDAEYGAGAYEAFYQPPVPPPPPY